MILVDSSGWIEFFSDGPLAKAYEAHLRELQEVLTPTLVLHEVYKVIKRNHGEEDAMIAAAQIAQTRLVPLGESIALLAGDLAIEHNLATADAIVYATARSHGVDVVTSDADFENLPGVRYLAKR